ncbi:MAG: hypothetical protein D6796_01510 [Caldilineae bacterium]|nr:MAG: hypothetical protein D6796_01510 [Caldilineae bacterium]
MNRQPYTIRELETIEAYHQAEEAQREIWAIRDDTEVLPLHMMQTAHKNGGLALGAFDGRERMIGFLFGFLGRTVAGRWKHCSHMMGVLPAWRRQGVGEALKRYQRRFVLRQGLDLITWTFDPLEGVNATLNFGKLGVICRTYHRNLYGNMADDLNRGLPSDRFEVEWWIASRRVEERLRGEKSRPRLADFEGVGVQPVNRAETRGALLHPAAADLTADAPRLLVETPADFQAIKAASMEVARAWRTHTRAIFEAYFQAGYTATEFFSEVTATGRRNFYLLQRAAPAEER